MPDHPPRDFSVRGTVEVGGGAGLKMLDDRLQRLSRQVVRARVLYDLWWLCAAKELREPHKVAFDRYSEFFRFLEHGLLIATLVQASIPFDSSKGTLSLNRAIKEITEAGGLDAAGAKALTLRLETVSAGVTSIQALRHNAFAHLSRAIGYNEAFTKAGLRPMDVRAVIDQAMGVVNALLTARDLDAVEPNSFPAEDGLSLLRDITDWDGGS